MAPLAALLLAAVCFATAAARLEAPVGAAGEGGSGEPTAATFYLSDIAPALRRYFPALGLTEFAAQLRQRAAALHARRLAAGGSADEPLPLAELNEPHSDAVAYTGVHPGIGYVSLTYESEASPLVVNADEFLHLWEAQGAVWSCERQAADDTQGVITVSLAPLPAQGGEDAALVLDFLTARLGAEGAVFVVGEALSRAPSPSGGLSNSTSCPPSFFHGVPYFTVLDVTVTDTPNALALRLTVNDTSLLSGFASVSGLEFTVNPHLGAVLQDTPDAPVYAPDGGLLGTMDELFELSTVADSALPAAVPKPATTTTSSGDDAAAARRLGTSQWDIVGWGWNRDGAPIPLGQPGIECIDCSVNTGLKAVLKLDFSVGVLPLRLKQLNTAAYLQGGYAVHSGLRVTSVTAAASKKFTFIEKKTLGKYKLVVGGLPIFFETGFSMEAEVRAAGSIAGLWHYAAKKEMSVKLGVQYDLTEGFSMISEKDNPPLSHGWVAPPALYRATGTIAGTLSPTFYLDLYGIAPFYAAFDGTITGKADYPHLCDNSSLNGVELTVEGDIALTLGVKEVRLEDILPWPVKKVVHGVMIPERSHSIPVYGPVPLITPRCIGLVPPTGTPTPSPSTTRSPSRTPSATVSRTPSKSASRSRGTQPPPSRTPSHTPSPSASPSTSASTTPSPSVSPSLTPSPSTSELPYVEPSPSVPPTWRPAPTATALSFPGTLYGALPVALNYTGASVFMAAGLEGASESFPYVPLSLHVSLPLSTGSLATQSPSAFLDALLSSLTSAPQPVDVIVHELAVNLTLGDERAAFTQSGSSGSGRRQLATAAATCEASAGSRVLVPACPPPPPAGAPSPTRLDVSISALVHVPLDGCGGIVVAGSGASAQLAAVVAPGDLGAFSDAVLAALGASGVASGFCVPVPGLVVPSSQDSGIDVTLVASLSGSLGGAAMLATAAAVVLARRRRRARAPLKSLGAAQQKASPAEAAAAAAGTTTVQVVSPLATLPLPVKKAAPAVTLVAAPVDGEGDAAATAPRTQLPSAVNVLATKEERATFKPMASAHISVRSKAAQEEEW